MTKKAVAKKAVTKKAPAKKSVKKPLEPKMEIQKQSNGREVIYNEIEVVKKIGEDPITVEYAKQLLGWQEEPEGAKFGEDYVKEVKSLLGVKVRLHNNVTNRPIYLGNVLDLTQEHLRRRWRVNCEPVIIGKTGLVLNGQHGLLSIILANHLWEANKDKYPEWKEAPTMEKLVAFGCEETDDVVNTLDTGKRRSLADCIFRSELFKDLKPQDRKAVAKICEFAVRQVWHRTGVGNAFSPDLRGTHAEFLDFIDRHPRILEAVKTVYIEEGQGEDKGKISRYISCGNAAGLLYLMGCSASDPTVYRQAEIPNENMLDWSLEDKASEFIVFLAGKAKALEAVSKALAKLLEDEDSTSQAKVATVIKAWNLFSKGEPVTVEALSLLYSTDGEERRLNEFPVVGGIDLGTHQEPEPDVAPEEIEKAKQQIQKEAEQPKKATKKATKKAVKKVSPPNKAVAIGDRVYISVEPGVWWSGVVKEWRGSSKGVMGRITVDKGFAGEGTIEEVPQDQLSLTEPTE